MITALLVDDESHATDRLAALLSALPTIDVIGTAHTVDDAERFLASRTPDVVFLDIDMPGRTGLDLAARVAPPTRIVLVTAHENYALDAFRIGATDYVLKPVDPGRLAITIDRLTDRPGLSSRAPEPAGRGEADEAESGASQRGEPVLVTANADPGSIQRIAAPPAAWGAAMISVSLAGGSGCVTLSLPEIAWVEAHRNYTHVQLVSERPLLVRGTITQWESILLPPEFGRLSRSLIVQVKAIRSLRWRSRDQTLVFFGGLEEPLPIGRTATTRLKQLLPR